jgi:hypothetical protein
LIDGCLVGGVAVEIRRHRLGRLSLGAGRGRRVLGPAPHQRRRRDEHYGDQTERTQHRLPPTSFAFSSADLHGHVLPYLQGRCGRETSRKLTEALVCVPEPEDLPLGLDGHDVVAGGAGSDVDEGLIDDVCANRLGS